jgi:hypothetical protein
MRLDTTAVRLPADTFPGIRRQAVRLDAAVGQGARDNSDAWSLDSLTDSLRVGFGSGFSGTEFVFQFHTNVSVGDTLHGRATEYWDFGPPFTTPRGKATAIRVVCP